LGENYSASVAYENMPRSEKEEINNVNLFVRFEVYTAVTMKNGVFWDVMPRGSCNNRRFGGT
jgi:hypothetical protein